MFDAEILVIILDTNNVGLGQNLATLEGLMALTLLLKRYKFTLVPNQEIKYSVALTYPLKNGTNVYVENRYH